MPHLVAAEGGPFGINFDQTVAGIPDEPTKNAQGFIVGPPRERSIHLRSQTGPLSIEYTEPAQAHLTLVIDVGGAELFLPTSSTHPDIGKRFSLNQIKDNLDLRASPTGRTLKTARRQRTTVSIHNLTPIEPNVDINATDTESKVVGNQKLDKPISQFKLETLTTGDGGLRSPTLRAHYQHLLTKSTR